MVHWCCLLLCCLGSLAAGDGPVDSDYQTLPMLGIVMTPLTPISRYQNRLFDQDAVRIHAILPGSGAEAAGTLRPGDVILAIDGEPVEGMVDLRRIIWDRDPGAVVVLDLSRRGEAVPATAILGPWPEHIPVEAIDAADEADYNAWSRAQALDALRRFRPAAYEAWLAARTPTVWVP